MKNKMAGWIMISPVVAAATFVLLSFWSDHYRNSNTPDAGYYSTTIGDAELIAMPTGTVLYYGDAAGVWIGAADAGLLSFNGAVETNWTIEVHECPRGQDAGGEGDWYRCYEKVVVHYLDGGACTCQINGGER